MKRAHRCGWCGTKPALGDAMINDTHYCHEGDSPTCYELATQDRSESFPLADVVHLPRPGLNLPPEKVMREVLGEHADDEQVRTWVHEFRLFMQQREIWYAGQGTGFWEKLGIMGDLPEHFPMDVNADGQGPMSPDPAHHWVCWCSDPKCPLTKALVVAWHAGRGSAQ